MNAKIRREANRIIRQDLERTGGKWAPIIEAMVEWTRKAFEKRALEKGT